MLLNLLKTNYLNRTNTFIKFLIVGSVNTFFGLSIILTLLNLLEVSYWIATFIGNSIGAIISFFLNKNITFRSKVKNSKGLALFFLVVMVSYFISYQVGYIFIIELDFLNRTYYKEEITVIVAAIIYTLLNYIGQRFLTFKY